MVLKTVYYLLCILKGYLHVRLSRTFKCNRKPISTDVWFINNIQYSNKRDRTIQNRCKTKLTSQQTPPNNELYYLIMNIMTNKLSQPACYTNCLST